MCLPWFRRRFSSDDNEKSSSKAHLQRTPSKESKSELTAVAQRPAQKGKAPSHPPFTRARALELFNTYRDQEVSTEDIIGSEGLEKLCSDAQLDMEGPKPLLLAWILGAKALGQFTKAEWEQGTSLWQ
jgi:DCN1-like protein 4/5